MKHASDIYGFRQAAQDTGHDTYVSRVPKDEMKDHQPGQGIADVQER